jgi:hypothetical protein
MQQVEVTLHSVVLLLPLVVVVVEVTEEVHKTVIQVVQVEVVPINLVLQILVLVVLELLVKVLPEEIRVAVVAVKFQAEAEAALEDLGLTGHQVAVVAVETGHTTPEMEVTDYKTQSVEPPYGMPEEVAVEDLVGIALVDQIYKATTD